MIKYIRVQVKGHTVVEFTNGSRACSCGVMRGIVPNLRVDEVRDGRGLVVIVLETFLSDEGAYIWRICWIAGTVLAGIVGWAMIGPRR